MQKKEVTGSKTPTFSLKSNITETYKYLSQYNLISSCSVLSLTKFSYTTKWKHGRVSLCAKFW